MDSLTTATETLLVGGLFTCALGAVVLYRLRHRPLREQMLAPAVLATVAAVAIVMFQVGAGAVVRPTTTAILIALGTALVLAIVFAWRLARVVAAALVLAGDQLRQLNPEGAPPQDRSRSVRPLSGRTISGRTRRARAPVPKELAQLHGDLLAAIAELAAARERDRLADQSRRELVTFLSHDLRTPLAGLRALTEGLEDGVIDDVPRALRHLRTVTARMSALVEDLFALTRLQGPGQDKQKTLVSLTEMIVDVTAELGPVGTGRQVEIRTDLPATDRLAVLGVPEDLARALMNLVANALRHTHAGAAITVFGRRAADGQIQIAVVDACGGIPELDLPLVFTTGWHGARPPDGEYGGAGLGLAIARSVIHSHEGRIAVHNVEGGCRFEVDLPVSHGQAVDVR